MADVRPFAAVMPPPDKAKAVADPPYDVVTAAEARRLAARNPLGFMRVSRAEVELADGTDPYSAQVYEKARENYRRLRHDVPLGQDDNPAFYVYALERAGHRQIGVVAAAAVDDYDRNVIRKHENTRPDKEDDRTRHILALRSQTGPVFLTYRDRPAIDELVAESMDIGERLFDFVADDSIRHRGWRVPAGLSAALQAAFADVRVLYIADGHHRAASASRARAELRRSENDPSDWRACDHFLAVIFPAGQLRILPYNRVVDSLNGHSVDSFLDALAKSPFTLIPSGSASPEKSGDVQMYLGSKWYCLRWSGCVKALSPAERLDVSLLQNHVLAPVLGIEDPRTSAHIAFVGGIRGTAELERRVDSGEGVVAFSMYPPTVAELMAISDADQVMPPKSTWFEPKLRDGLFVHDI